MKYRHVHHAGNFADVVKHAVLVEILKNLARKPAPFCYLETHAGRGAYALSQAQLQPGSEYGSGFGRLSGQENLPPALAGYTQIVRQLGSAAAGGQGLERYPGSPLIAAGLLRPTDRAVLFEIQAAEAQVLRDTLHPYLNVAVHHGDGLQGLLGQLPPRERRGLVLIDPAYELQEGEFPQVLNTLRCAYERWPTGIYTIWYPIKQAAAVARWHETLQQTGIRKILDARMQLFPADSRVSLNGCGMIIVNPPWQLDQTLAGMLPALKDLLGTHSGAEAGCAWLVPE